MRKLAPLAAALPLLLLGAALFAIAAQAGRAWADRHVNLWWVWFPTPDGDVSLGVRAVAAAAGALCVALAALAAWMARKSTLRGVLAGGARISVAGLLALGVGEWLLRRAESSRTPALHEKLGVPDARVGWIYRPGLSTTQHLGPREVKLDFNSLGLRAAGVHDEPDWEKPTLLVAGESVAVGHGLQWAETFGALIAARSGLQVVNAAVNGYSFDQACLRMMDLLPRLKRPVAVLTTFLPVQLLRNAETARPRVVFESGELEFAPPSLLGRLQSWKTLHDRLPYLSGRSLERSLELTQALVRAVVAEAGARGARTLFLVLSRGPSRALSAHREAWILREVFEAQAIDYLLIDVDEALLIGGGDLHPGPEAARLIAAAVEQRLGL
jgi:hypothetical protein